MLLHACFPSDQTRQRRGSCTTLFSNQEIIVTLDLIGFRGAMAENRSGQQKLAEYLGDLSPLSQQPQQSRVSGSVSLKHSDNGHSMAKMSDQSTRRPLGELQGNTFEFPRHMAGKDVKPMSNAYKSKASSMAATPDQTPPCTPMSTMSIGESQPDSDAARYGLADTLSWRSPVHSTCMLLLGLTMIGLVMFAAYGAHRVTLVSAACYVLLAHMCYNFVVFLLSKSWHESSMWGSADWTLALANKAAAAVKGAAALHDAYLSTKDPQVTLKVAAALWGLAWVSSVLSFWQLVTGAYLAAFLVPLVVMQRREDVAALGRRLRGATLDKIDSSGMPRTTRGLFLAASLLVLWLVAGWVQTGLGAFVAATYWRTWLAPKQVEAYRQKLAPVTHSVQKAGRYINGKASGMLSRYQASTSGPSRRTRSVFSKTE